MKVSNKHLNIQSPIAVFDSGIGSYSIVHSIKKVAPKQDIIYFADRKSFPYGNKNSDELFYVVSRAIRLLETYCPAAIVIASNVPSVTLLPRLKSICDFPIYGIFPPIQEAMQKSVTKSIGVLAVQSLASHPSIHSYIANQTDTPEKVHVINASSLVETVESGEFLFNIPSTEKAIRLCIDQALNEFSSVDTFTLSSTHLPWLKSYFERLYPNHYFVDPAASMVASLPLKNSGTGFITGIVSESDSAALSKDNFSKMMSALDIYIDIIWIENQGCS